MLVFKQDLSSYSRLGNSLSWVSKVAPLISEFEFHYPWAAEQLSDYLDPDSSWIKKYDENYSKLKNIFGFESSNNNLY